MFPIFFNGIITLAIMLSIMIVGFCFAVLGKYLQKKNDSFELMYDLGRGAVILVLIILLLLIVAAGIKILLNSITT